MKMIIFGSRTFTDYEKFSDVLEDFMSSIDDNGDYVEAVISGGAMGTDQMAERFFKEREVEPTVIKPDYARYPGNLAPLKRNEEMVKLVDNNTACVCFWDGESRGTLHMLGLLVQAGYPVNVFSTNKK